MLPQLRSATTEASTRQRSRAATIEVWNPQHGSTLRTGAGTVRCVFFGTLRSADGMRREPILRVAFCASAGGREAVRDWLRELVRRDLQTIGTDLKTVPFGWPMGMPLIRKLDADLWEVRSRHRDGVARTMFTVEGNTMVILMDDRAAPGGRRPL